MEDFKKQLEELYGEYCGRFYAAAYALLKNKAAAEDAVSETFLRLIENRGKFEGLEKEKRAGYAKTVLKNICIDMIRNQSKHGSSELTDELAAEDLSAQEITESGDAYNGLVGLIRSMPDSLRQALCLRINYSLKANQIAKALGISHEAARKRLSDAYKQIREFIKEDNHE